MRRSVMMWGKDDRRWKRESGSGKGGEEGVA